VKKQLRKLLNRIKPEATKTANDPKDDPLGFIDGFLTGLLVREGKVGVLQCGANDGVTVDPIRRFLVRHQQNVSAVLVEPLPDVFEVLTANYSEHAHVTCLNMALGPAGDMTLYRIRAQYTDLYQGIIASGITSFDRDFVRRKSMLLTGIDDIPLDQRIEEVAVKAVTASDLIEQHSSKIGRKPFVQIDAEGFDDQVIYSVNFDKHRPIGINYEISKLSDDKLSKLRDHLAGYGYKTIRWGQVDELAYLAV